MKKGDTFDWLWQGEQELMGSQEESFHKNLLRNNHYYKIKVKTLGFEARLPGFNFRSAS